MKTLTLNGAWQMRQADTDTWHEAIVPGSVYADLMRDGSMPDPFWRENEREAFELLRNDFEYKRSFAITEDDLAHGRILLHCEGLDTLGHVYVNGSKVADVDNMHVTWEWDVKSLLHAGENEILIHFDSPIEFALAAYEASPAWESSDATPGFSHVRKAHCMYGWDWGPACRMRASGGISNCSWWMNPASRACWCCKTTRQTG